MSADTLRDMHETRDLRDRITAALVVRVLAEADTVMNVVNAALADRDARIRELEGKVCGTLDRRCVIPGCSASHPAETGPPAEETTAERHWLRKSSPALLLCPDHSRLWEGDNPHAPRMDYDTRTCACTCGHPLPGPTLGHMGTAWIAHALALLDADEQQNHQEPVEAGLRNRIATALEPVATPRHRSAEVAQWIADDIMHVAEAEIAQGLRRAADGRPLPTQEAGLHNALADARHVMDCLHHLGITTRQETR